MNAKSKKPKSVSLKIIAVLGWVAALFLGLLELPAKINSFFVETPKAKDNITTWILLDTEFTGSWSSDIEGWVDATDEDIRLAGGEDGPVALKIKIYAGEAEGEITSNGLKKNYIYSNLLLAGNKSRSRVELLAYDFVEGKKRVFAKLELAHSDRSANILVFRTIEQSLQLFPLEARLYRKEDSMEIPGQINFDFFKSILRCKNDSKGKHSIECN